jgi:hypothetical protein
MSALSGLSSSFLKCASFFKMGLLCTTDGISRAHIPSLRCSSTRLVLHCPLSAIFGSQFIVAGSDSDDIINLRVNALCRFVRVTAPRASVSAAFLWAAARFRFTQKEGAAARRGRPSLTVSSSDCAFHRRVIVYVLPLAIGCLLSSARQHHG